MSGPLAGLRIIEFAGIGPAPFCGMMLADHGAEVIRLDRPTAHAPTAHSKESKDIAAKDVLARSRKSLAVNLKSPQGVEIARKLCATSNGLIEGYRPGVMERLGLGPDVLLKDNPKLVYGRMTGWGQSGPYAHAAGHDINYIALSGALYHYGRANSPPTPPINMVGDFGGGGMLLAFGMVAALLAVQRGGEGQVIDCAMTDGSALLMAMIQGMRNSGLWDDRRGHNIIDSGAHFYDSYRCADGEYISIGAIEPQFYATLRDLLGLADDSTFDAQMHKDTWPERKEKLAALFATKSRAEWCSLLDVSAPTANPQASEACFAPVLSLAEAPDHPHNKARNSYIRVGADIQPAPAPRYSATPTAPPQPAPTAGADSNAILAAIGMSAS